jgi:hypothetical protein
VIVRSVPATVQTVVIVSVALRFHWLKAVRVAVPRWARVMASLPRTCWALSSMRVAWHVKLKDTRVAGKQLKLRRYRED